MARQWPRAAQVVTNSEVVAAPELTIIRTAPKPAINFRWDRTADGRLEMRWLLCAAEGV
jgi:hypothetical protein